MGEPDLTKVHAKEVAKLEAAIDAYKTEIRRLCKAVERAEENAAKWRRKAKKLKKRVSSVIVEAAPELANLPEFGDVA
jgi:phage shock protein A